MVDSKKSVQVFIGVFVVVLLGVILVDPLATVFKGSTVRDTVVNETIDVSTLRSPGTNLNTSLSVDIANLSSGYNLDYF